MLARLREQAPSPLTRYPSLDSDEGGPPPFTVGLASWATGAAGELHRQFGDQVDLTVGALPYPPGTSPRPRPGSPPRSSAAEPPDLLDPDEVTAALDGPAVVRSGATLDHGLLLTNHTTRELQIMTNGRVTATVVDPGTGERVGGFSGAQTLPGGFDPRLGYTVPAGQWGIQTTLTFSSGDPGSAGPGPVRLRRRTPILPLTITT